MRNVNDVEQAIPLSDTNANAEHQGPYGTLPGVQCSVVEDSIHASHASCYLPSSNSNF